MRALHTKIIILSAEHKTNSPEKNRQLTQNLISDMIEMRLNFIEGKGFFDGHEEVSFMVFPKNNDEIDSLCHLATKVYKQDCVLFQDNEGISHLLNKDFSCEELGQLVEVDSTDGLDAYSIFNNKIITIKR